MVRAVPHTIASTGSSGITPSSRPPMETGTWCTPSHMLAMAPNAPVMSLLAMSNCSSDHRRDHAQRHDRRPERDPEAGHEPGVCRLAGCPLAGSLLAQAHARDVDARAAQTTTGAGRTGRKTPRLRLAPVSESVALLELPRRRLAVGRESGGRRRGSRSACWARRESARSTDRLWVATAVLRRIAGPLLWLLRAPAGAAARADGAGP